MRAVVASGRTVAGMATIPSLDITDRVAGETVDLKVLVGRRSAEIAQTGVLLPTAQNLESARYVLNASGVPEARERHTSGGQ